MGDSCDNCDYEIESFPDSPPIKDNRPAPIPIKNVTQFGNSQDNCPKKYMFTKLKNRRIFDKNNKTKVNKKLISDQISAACSVSVTKSKFKARISYPNSAVNIDRKRKHNLTSNKCKDSDDDEDFVDASERIKVWKQNIDNRVKNQNTVNTLTASPVSMSKLVTYEGETYEMNQIHFDYDLPIHLQNRPKIGDEIVVTTSCYSDEKGVVIDQNEDHSISTVRLFPSAMIDAEDSIQTYLTMFLKRVDELELMEDDQQDNHPLNENVTSFADKRDDAKDYKLGQDEDEGNFTVTEEQGGEEVVSQQNARDTEFEVKGHPRKNTQSLVDGFDDLPVHSRVIDVWKPIRKQSDKIALPSTVCQTCRPYIECMGRDMSEDEYENFKKKICRHKGNTHQLSDTPPDFWNTKIPCTQDLYEKGYIRQEGEFEPGPSRLLEPDTEDLQMAGFLPEFPIHDEDLAKFRRDQFVKIFGEYPKK